MKCPGIPGTVMILPGVICCGAAMFVAGREGRAILSLPTPSFTRHLSSVREGLGRYYRGPAAAIALSLSLNSPGIASPLSLISIALLRRDFSGPVAD